VARSLCSPTVVTVQTTLPGQPLRTCNSPTGSREVVLGSQILLIRGTDHLRRINRTEGRIKVPPYREEQANLQKRNRGRMTPCRPSLVHIHGRKTFLPIRKVPWNLVDQSLVALTHTGVFLLCLGFLTNSGLINCRGELYVKPTYMLLK
jgi:hypothetical protein